jgi:hypothetical protein
MDVMGRDYLQLPQEVSSSVGDGGHCSQTQRPTWWGVLEEKSTRGPMGWGKGHVWWGWQGGGAKGPFGREAREE